MHPDKQNPGPSPAKSCQLGPAHSSPNACKHKSFYSYRVMGHFVSSPPEAADSPLGRTRHCKTKNSARGSSLRTKMALVGKPYWRSTQRSIDQLKSFGFTAIGSRSKAIPILSTARPKEQRTPAVCSEDVT